MAVDEYPDRVRGLRRESVDLKGAQQGDGRVRDASGDLDQRVQLRDRRLGEPVEPAINAFQEAALAQPSQVSRGPEPASRSSSEVLVAIEGMLQNVGLKQY
jgi:hypothetical protein